MFPTLHIVILGSLWGTSVKAEDLNAFISGSQFLHCTLWQKSLLLAMEGSWGQPHGFPWWWAGVESSCQDTHSEIMSLPFLDSQKGTNLTYSWTVPHIVHPTNGHSAQDWPFTLLKAECFLSSWTVWSSIIIANLSSLFSQLENSELLWAGMKVASIYGAHPGCKGTQCGTQPV